MKPATHQYVARRSGEVRTEGLTADRLVNFLYNEIRENVPAVFKALTGSRASGVLGYLNFDSFLGARFRSPESLRRAWRVDERECLDPPETLDTPDKLFRRKIKYWDCRPMSADERVVTAPADSRMLIGSFRESSLLYIKDKFFDFAELLGPEKTGWLKEFTGGDFAVFRLTPDKYHYNHTPVAGRVIDFYEIDGEYHACNPGAVISLVTPFSKNRRVVTIFDTDRPGGTGVGLTAMVEVVALMVGDIENCYSREAYDNPLPVKPGMFLKKGRPKSLFRPGSSTVVLLFQAGRMEFDEDLLKNQRSSGVSSRYSKNFGMPLVETEVEVRSGIGRALGPPERRLGND